MREIFAANKNISRISKGRPSMVTHALLGRQRSRGLWFEATLDKKFLRVHFNQWLGCGT
jgi:hypothetical protein